MNKTPRTIQIPSKAPWLAAAAIATSLGIAVPAQANQTSSPWPHIAALVPGIDDTALEPEPTEQDPSWISGWTGSIQFGLNGSEGNTDRLNLRFGFDAARLGTRMETRIVTSYSYATSDGDTTENKARLDVRNDWLIKDSRWRYFVLGLLEYDRFQDWDFRASIFPGVGYEFIKTERTLLLGRAGAGVTREFGGERNEFIPEALLGADLEHKLTERQRLTATVNFFPELDNFGDYRLNARAAWEILVDPEINLSLKLGVENRYDSDPAPGIRRNDFDYFALLAWSF
jgi:putative salt-induced outer membrane protein YdiY